MREQNPVEISKQAGANGIVVIQGIPDGCLICSLVYIHSTFLM